VDITLTKGIPMFAMRAGLALFTPALGDAIAPTFIMKD